MYFMLICQHVLCTLHNDVLLVNVLENFNEGWHDLACCLEPVELAQLVNMHNHEEATGTHEFRFLRKLWLIILIFVHFVLVLIE